MPLKLFSRVPSLSRVLSAHVADSNLQARIEKSLHAAKLLIDFIMTRLLFFSHKSHL